MYAFLYVCRFFYECTYLCWRVCTFCVYACACVCLRVCIWLSLRVCTAVCWLCARVCACVHVLLFACVHAFIFADVHLLVYVCERVWMCLCCFCVYIVFVCMHVHVCTRLCMVHVHGFVFACVHHCLHNYIAPFNIRPLWNSKHGMRLIYSLSTTWPLPPKFPPLRFLYITRSFLYSIINMYYVAYLWELYADFN